MTATKDTARPGDATFVLVHGGWGGGFVYNDVAAILRGRGNCVFTPTLTGVGSRSHLMRPGIDLATHVDDVVNEITWEGLSDIVLAGHSYGGMVITGVADRIPERIAAIVYLDAFLPEDGQSILDLAAFQEIIDQLKAARERGEHAFPFPAEFAAALGIPEDALWKYTPHPLATLTEPIRLTGKHKTIKNKIFVRAAEWPDHEHVVERLKNDSAWTTITVPTGHMVQWDAPQRTAGILEAAV